MIKQVRYDYIKKKVCEVFITNKINKLPTDIKRIYDNYRNCRIIPYTKFMKDHSLSQYEVINFLGSEDGCSILEESTGKYLVFVNDIDYIIFNPLRRKWTLAHELGHIVLAHHIITNKTKLNRDGLSKKEYKLLEKEADFFASILLAPPIILYHVGIKSADDIKKLCKISTQASKNRYKSYKRWLKFNSIDYYDHLLLEHFSNFIYQKKCIHCSYGFVHKCAKYCPICGEKLQWGEGRMKYNDGYELDENGRAFKCPTCENEQIGENEEEEYCIICGTYLVNRCTHTEDEYDDFNGELIKPACGMIVPGNARYCPYCGSETTFFRDKLLLPWEEAQKQILEEKERNEKEINEEVAASIYEEELPF